MINVNEYRLGLIVMDAKPYDKLYKIDIGMLINAINGIPYRPVQLTPELLDRCGFEKAKEEDGDYYVTYTILKLDGGISKEDDGWYHRITDVDGYYDQRVGVKIEYVHQLQNKFFDQTGEELKIEL
jgi:hypothetical protein